MTIVYVVSGTSWTVPVDWNSASNTIENIGGGGAGRSGSTSSAGGAGGGGGEYRKITNQTLTPNVAVTVQVGAGGATVGTAGTATFVKDNSSTTVIQANGGAGGPAASTPAAGGTGGTGPGGNNNGGASGDATATADPSGGGGAGGPLGVGGAGAAGDATGGGGGGGNGGGSAGNPAAGTAVGGNNQAGTGGGARNTAGTVGGGGGGSTTGSGGNGGPGTEWDSTHGSGGGGGGGGTGGTDQPGNGGLYGGGGGGSNGADTKFGTGANGIIVATYTPASAYLSPSPPQQAPVQYRAASAMPQRVAAGLALFATAAIVSVPIGTAAQIQSAAAYREASRLTAQPPAPSAVFAVVATGQAVPPPVRTVQPAPQAWPNAVFADLIGGPAVLIQAAPVLKAGIGQPPQVAPWSYVAAMLKPPSALQFGITPIYLGAPAIAQPGAAPWPYAAAQTFKPLPIIAALAQLAPPVVPQMQTPTWPYAAMQLLQDGPAPLIPSLGVQIPPAPVLQWITQPAYPYASTLLPMPTASEWATATAYALAPVVQPTRAPEWPYAATQPGRPLPIITPAAQISPPPVLQLVPSAWPHWLAQHELPDTMDVLPNLGTQIPPSPVLQWITQTPYPYAATLLPEPTASQFATPATYTFSPAINPVRPADWPYVATMLPEPVSSQWGQSTAYALSPVLNPVREPEWPYVGTMLPPPTASRWAQQAGQPAPAPTLTPQMAQQPWPHALIAAAPVRAVGAGANVPPSFVAQIAQAAWPYGAAMRGAGIATLAQQTYLAPAPVWTLPATNWPYAKHAAVQPRISAFSAFVAGNSEVWLIDMRQRSVTVARLQRDTEVDARPRVWNTPEH